MTDSIFSLAADVLDCLLGPSARHALPVAGAGARRDLYAYDAPEVYACGQDDGADFMYLSDDSETYCPQYDLPPARTPPPAQGGSDAGGPGPVLGNALLDCAADFPAGRLAPTRRRRESSRPRRWRGPWPATSQCPGGSPSPR